MPAMDLKTLLRANGSGGTLYLYAMAYALLGAMGSLLVAIQYSDWIWAELAVVMPLLCAAFLVTFGHIVWAAFGPRLPAAAGLTLTVVGGCLLWQFCEMYIHDDVLGFGPWYNKPYLYRYSGVRIPLLWWGLAAAAWYALKRAEALAEEVARTKLTGDELRASTAEARLQALQAQVEPHFLFNTLAHVKWLYRRDRVRGRHMLDRFLDYLHAALPRVRCATTTLGEEVQLAHAYLDIQQLRIGGRLTYTIEVPEEIGRLRFPPLMLLTLVENAIKHGIAPQTEGGTIVIRAVADDNLLRIEVRDTGAGLREAAGTGMGLANVRARLAALFGAGARLVIEPNVPHGVVAAIEIPR